jgi:L,D-transpeptidase catalytic domain
MRFRTTLITALALALFLSGGPAALASDDVGVVDTRAGKWYLRDSDNSQTTAFYYGNPGDVPFMGDWDCDGTDTPGLYRQSDGFVYLRNSSTQGVADRTFYFGDPGDLPLAGDFDGDGCDTVSVYRPSQGRVYMVNELGADGAGLGVADTEFIFGDPGDVPFSGDFDGDGVDGVGVYRPSTGTAHLMSGLGNAASTDPVPVSSGGGTVVAGDWGGGVDQIASYSPAGTFRLPGASFPYGYEAHRPVAGDFGSLPGGDDPPPSAPPYPAVGSGKRIIYSDSQQRVWLIDEGEALVSTYLVSGRQGIPLPGDYQVYSKSVKAYAPYGGITMANMVRFVPPGSFGNRYAYGFHAIPRYPNGQPMQTVDELGYYRSGGCIRQEEWRAVFLFGWADLGTAVHVLP